MAVYFVYCSGYPGNKIRFQAAPDHFVVLHYFLFSLLLNKVVEWICALSGKLLIEN